MQDSAFGSLRVCPKRDKSPLDDGTTTRAGKWAAAGGGINLTLPVRSIRRHRQARTRIVIGCIALALIVALVLRWASRSGFLN